MNTLIDCLCEQLKKDEGWSPTVYHDSRGLLTIGFGFLVDPSTSGGLPADVAEYWLREVVGKKLGDLYRALPWLSSQPRQVQLALGNMAYQLGVSGVQEFDNMLAKLKAGDRSGAADAALDSRWAKQTPNRAKRIAQMIRG